MSDKPKTNFQDGPGGSDSGLQTLRPAGRRFSGSEEVLRIERELVAAGTDLPNRAIPEEFHPRNREYSESDVRDLLEEEAEKEHPNKQLIALLNEQL